MYVIGIILLVTVISLFATGRKGKNRWENYRRGGEGLLEDFDKECKDIEKYMK